jgi:hypothetical protein
MKNIDSNILSALIGAAVSLFVLILTIFWDRIKEWLDQIDRRKKKLIYAAAIIKPIIVYSKEQANNMKNFAEALRQNPLEFPLLTFGPKSDIEKFIHQVDDEFLFEAFTTTYKPYWVSVRTFKSITSTISYQNLQIEQVLEMIKTSSSFDYERKVKFKEYIKTSTNFATEAIANLTLQEHPDFLKLLDQSLINYLRHRSSPSDLKNAYENFIEPVIIGIVNNQYYHIPVAQQIITVLYDAREIYFEINMQMESLSKDFLEISEKYSKYNEGLIIHSKDLLNDFFD